MSFDARDKTTGEYVFACAADEGGQFTCLECGEDVRLRAKNSTYFATHFYHPSGDGHESGGESPSHYEIKWGIINALNAAGIKAKAEYDLKERRADVLVFMDNRPACAVEVQLSYQTSERRVERTESYASKGIHCIWVAEDGLAQIQKMIPTWWQSVLKHIERTWGEEAAKLDAIAEAERLRVEAERLRIEREEEWKRIREEAERLRIEEEEERRRLRLEAERLRIETEEEYKRLNERLKERAREELHRREKEREEESERRRIEIEKKELERLEKWKSAHGSEDSTFEDMNAWEIQQEKDALFAIVQERKRRKDEHRNRMSVAHQQTWDVFASYQWPMTLQDLRDEFMEPTFNRKRETLLPFIAECALAASYLPCFGSFMDAGEKLRMSRKSPLASACTPSYLKGAWSTASEDDIAARWVQLHGNAA
jgi:competence CoiA-like predicted nuclease